MNKCYSKFVEENAQLFYEVKWVWKLREDMHKRIGFKTGLTAVEKKSNFWQGNNYEPKQKF